MAIPTFLLCRVHLRKSPTVAYRLIAGLADRRLRRRSDIFLVAPPQRTRVPPETHRRGIMLVIFDRLNRQYRRCQGASNTTVLELRQEGRREHAREVELQRDFGAYPKNALTSPSQP